MFSADDSDYYNGDFYTQYNTGMKPTTSSNMEPRLSLDSGLGLTNDSFYSTDLSESQLMDLTAATSSDVSFSFHSGPLESSPPTKWARVRTPPNRKKSANAIEEEPISPDFHLFTPPNRKRVRSIFSSPSSSMKTPESLRKSIRISSPSPFKVTFSKTPLKLSNNENVTGFHIGKHGAYYNKKVTGSASKRCLLQARPDGFTVLGSPNSDVLDFPLQTAFDGFDLFGDTPEKINPAQGIEEDTMDYHQYAGMIERSYSNTPPTLEAPKFESVKSTSIVRTASRNLLKNTKESFAIVTHHPLPEHKRVVTPTPIEPTRRELPKKVRALPAKKQSVKDELVKEAKEKEMTVWKKTPFVTPKKKLQLYSGRWLVISTGRTMAQQELFADAKKFFRTHRPTLPTPVAPKPHIPARRLPTIARVTLFKHRYQSWRV